jgi:hypothetical protein
MTDEELIERLRDTGCDREPFTPEHAKCICRLTNKAADRIEALLSLSTSCLQPAAAAEAPCAEAVDN